MVPDGDVGFGSIGTSARQVGQLGVSAGCCNQFRMQVS
jgi:hypothetical protein